MTTEKEKILVYLSAEDKKKLHELMIMMLADSMTETVRRLIREKYKELAEPK